jgi:uroporphyrin-3 C-methyltransferase
MTEHNKSSAVVEETRETVETTPQPEPRKPLRRKTAATKPASR